MKNRNINLSGPMLIVVLTIMVGLIFLAYLGYDWFSGYKLDPSSQNTEESGNAFRGTLFVLGLLFIALYKIRKNEKMAEIRRHSTGVPQEKTSSIYNSPANIAINMILVAVVVLFAIGSLPLLVWGLMPLID